MIHPSQSAGSAGHLVGTWGPYRASLYPATGEVMLTVDPGVLKQLSRSERRELLRGVRKAAEKAAKGSPLLVDGGAV